MSDEMRTTVEAQVESQHPVAPRSSAGADTERVVRRLERLTALSEASDIEDGETRTFTERVSGGVPSSPRRNEATGPASLEVEGACAGRLLPAPLRLIAALTGILLLTSITRLVLRFLFGVHRRGRLWLDGDTVLLEASFFVLGREMRRVRRSFGPEGLLTVMTDVRYPYLFLFVGVFALFFGTIAGTAAFLDGTLAGFEEWIRVGAWLLIGGLVIDLFFTVLAATRPGRTTLSVTFHPNTTVRLLRVDSVRATAFLEALARRSNQGQLGTDLRVDS